MMLLGWQRLVRGPKAGWRRQRVSTPKLRKRSAPDVSWADTAAWTAEHGGTSGAAARQR